MKRKEAFLGPRASGFAAGGFTLIELMIVVTIMAIIAAVAVPSYRNYNKRANRSAAAQLLLNIQNREEQYVLDARSYLGNLGSGGLNIVSEGWTCTNDTAVPSTSSCSNSFYVVSVTLSAGPPISYSIAAVPKATTYQGGFGVAADSDGTLTLTGAGTRSRSAGDFKW